MATCTIRWRSSGGRGEFEYVPSGTLEDRAIDLYFEPLALTIPSEVTGVKAQGKPRLRKKEKNNRRKFHLPQLVMAVARLPEPAREDITHSVSFPLENKSFVMNEMHFDIIEDDGMTAVLAPLWVSILHSDFEINLHDRFHAVASDLANINEIRLKHPRLADAIQEHGNEIMKGINSTNIRIATDKVLKLQSNIYGMTNVGSALKLQQADSLPETELDAEIKGKEGKLLTRIHYYKERDRAFTAKTKKFYKSKNNGKLICESCGLDPVKMYGSEGERCIEGHHKIPIEELQPDSVTSIDDMAMVCASCHRIIHSRKPCLTIQEIKEIIKKNK
jgi:predicted HNH restriction endonuclease